MLLTLPRRGSSDYEVSNSGVWGRNAAAATAESRGAIAVLRTAAKHEAPSACLCQYAFHSSPSAVSFSRLASTSHGVLGCSVARSA